jgi:hypothetical protein
VYLHKIQWYAQGLVLLLKNIACNWLVIMIGQGGNIWIISHLKRVQVFVFMDEAREAIIIFWWMWKLVIEAQIRGVGYKGCVWTSFKFIYEKKFICFFFSPFYLSHRDLPRQDTSSCMLGTIGKPLVSQGALSWFHNVSTYSEEVIEHWTFLSLKISLNI